MAKLLKSIGKVLSWLNPIGRIVNSIGLAKNLYSAIKEHTSDFAGVGDYLGNFAKGVTGAGLTTAQIEQNEWNSQEAQIARDWEERMDNTKYQRQTGDMLAAGLNPALMYGGSVSSSTPSAAQASGSSVAAPSAGVLDSIINMIFAKQRLANLRSEGRLIDAQTKDAESSANQRDADTELKKSEKNYKDLLVKYYPAISESQIDLNKELINKYVAEVKVDESKVKNLDADTALLDTRNYIEKINKEWLPRLNAAKEKSDLASAAASYARAAIDGYSLEFAKEHGGQMPGFNSWLGVATALEGVLKDIGFGEINYDDSSLDYFKGSFMERFASFIAFNIAKSLGKFGN